MHLFAFSELFKLCEAENINFVEYFVIDKHFEQIFQTVETESFLYELLNIGIHCMHHNFERNKVLISEN